MQPNATQKSRAQCRSVQQDDALPVHLKGTVHPKYHPILQTTEVDGANNQ